MVTQDLITYIKTLQDKGVSREDITSKLVEGGWASVDVEEAINKVGGSNLPVKDVEKVTAVPTQSESNTVMSQDNTRSSQANNVKEVVSPQMNTGYDSSDAHQIHYGTVLVTVLVLLFISGGLVFGYNAFFQKDLSAHEVIVQMLEKQNTVLSVRNSTEIEISGSAMMDGDKMTFDTLVDSTSAYDSHDLQNIKLEGSISIGSNYAVPGAGVDFSGVFDYKYVDNTIFFRVRDVSPLPIPVDISEYTEKWYDLNLEAIGELIGEDFDIQKIIEDGYVQAETFNTTFIRMINKPEVKEFINRVFVPGANETVDGVKTYKYDIVLSQDDWSMLIDNFYEVLMLQLSESQSFLATELLESADGYTYAVLEELGNELESNYNEFITSGMYSETLAILENTHFTIWVGKADSYLRKMEVVLNLESFHPVPEVSLDFLFRTTQELSDYNKEIDVVAPDDSTPVLALFQSLVLDSLEDAKNSANEAAVKANLNAIVPNAMLYYDDNGQTYNSGGSSSNDCTVGVFIHERNIRALENAQESGGTPVCTIAINGKSFAVSVPFADGLNSWCVGYNEDGSFSSFAGVGTAVGGGFNEASCESAF